MDNKKKILIILILIITLVSCNNNQDLYGELDNYLKSCKTKVCVIDFDRDLNNLIKKDWDSVYMIEGEYPNYIDKFNGRNDIIFSEAMPKILFVKDNNIIYQEGYDVNIGQKMKGILIDYTLKPYLKTSRKKAKFIIIRADSESLYLKPLYK